MSKKKPTPFKVGAKIVYPSHGIGTIFRIDEESSHGFGEPCYVIRFESGMTIMAPFSTSVVVGLRNVIPRRRVKEVIDLLQDGSQSCIESNWNKRQKSYQEKIKSGSILEVASVFRDLFHLRSGKGLSFGEQQVFDMAHKLVVSELAVARGVREETITKEIDAILAPEESIVPTT